MNRQVRDVVLWFPPFRSIHVMKDPGQIAEHLAEIGYNVKIVRYQDRLQAECPASIGKAQVETLQCTHRLSRLLGLPFYWYLIKNRGTIHCLILYFASLTSAVTSLLFKLLNRGGICIVKMDSDGRLYRSSGLLIKQLRSKQGAIGYETRPYRRNLGIRVLSRLIGELRFRILAYTTDLLTIESPEAMERVLQAHPWLRRRIAMLPNGVCTKRLDELSRSLRDQGEQSPLCGQDRIC